MQIVASPKVFLFRDVDAVFFIYQVLKFSNVICTRTLSRHSCVFNRVQKISLLQFLFQGFLHYMRLRGTAPMPDARCSQEREPIWETRGGRQFNTSRLTLRSIVQNTSVIVHTGINSILIDYQLVTMPRQLLVLILCIFIPVASLTSTHTDHDTHYQMCSKTKRKSKIQS